MIPIFNNYYYFVSTLPSLTYGEKPPIPSSSFLDECYSLLKPRDAALLPYCCFDPKLAVETLEPTGSEFIDSLLQRERTFALNLVYMRSAKLNRPLPPEPPQDIPRTVAAAKAAFEMDDPLTITLYIDRSRWGALDTMTGLEDMFGVNNIFIHLLKLQLLERKLRLDPKKGRIKYRECYDAILGAYSTGA